MTEHTIELGSFIESRPARKPWTKLEIVHKLRRPGAWRLVGRLVVGVFSLVTFQSLHSWMSKKPYLMTRLGIRWGEGTRGSSLPYMKADRVCHEYVKEVAIIWRLHGFVGNAMNSWGSDNFFGNRNRKTHKNTTSGYWPDTGMTGTMPKLKTFPIKCGWCLEYLFCDLSIVHPLPWRQQQKLDCKREKSTLLLGPRKPTWMYLAFLKWGYHQNHGFQPCNPILGWTHLGSWCFRATVFILRWKGCRNHWGIWVCSAIPSGKWDDDFDQWKWRGLKLPSKMSNGFKFDSIPLSSHFPKKIQMTHTHTIYIYI